MVSHFGRPGEDPLVGRVAAGVQHGQSHGPVVGVVDRALLAPGQVEAHGDHDLGPQPPERRGQVAAQREAVLHKAVDVVEELHVSDPDQRGPAHLLVDPQGTDLGRVHARDAGLASGGQQVGDLLALAGPAGHGRGGTVLQVIGMGDHGDGSVPVLGHGLQPWHGYLRRSWAVLVWTVLPDTVLLDTVLPEA